MPKTRINKRVYERCLLTEIVPFETPILFSNWGSFNYQLTVRQKDVPMLKYLFDPKNSTIPYTFAINKDIGETRTLHVPHPCLSRPIVDFYQNFDVIIPKTCSTSSFSIRSPHNIAKWFLLEKGKKSFDNYVEQLDENNAYASSYFVYKHFSHLYKFFESKTFTSLENRFCRMTRFDVSKCFPSIYTHSISWAMRGKNEAKRLHFEKIDSPKSFPNSFDDLMQRMNYKETNGILVGPELSRIFAEIILQSVDGSVETLLRDTDNNLTHHGDYVCCRYIDDYYLFFNNDRTEELFEKVLKSELGKYKLHLNQSKREVASRPFITEASLLKIEVSKYVSDLSARAKKYHGEWVVRNKDPRTMRADREVNRLRAVIGNQEDAIVKVTSFFLGSLNSSFKYTCKTFTRKDCLLEIALIYFELSLHWFKLDMRVAGSYKVLELTLEVLRKLKELPPDSISRAKSTMYFELMDALNLACERRSGVEALNILMCLKNLGTGYELPPAMVHKVLLHSQAVATDDGIPQKRNSYFEIVSIIYYISDAPQYADTKKMLLEESVRIISMNSVAKYSESLMLFLDLISCPHVDKSWKQDLYRAVAATAKLAIDDTKVNEGINKITQNSWYFNWLDGGDMRRLLKKKRFMLSY